MAAFDRWSDRIATAPDDDARRALLVEIARWRAGHLSDVPALRDAHFAMSKLFARLGDSASATREAQALVSLCQTPPEASRDELGAATSWLTGLGGTSVVAPSMTQRERPPRRERERRPEPKPQRAALTPQEHVAELARAGRFEEAFNALRGKKGPRVHLARIWVQLRQAMAAEGPEQRRLLEQLDARLAPDAAPPGREPAAAAQQPPESSALENLIGRALPRSRGPRLQVLEAWASEHAERIDELASTALLEHVATAGPKAPAPWLVGFVGRALSSGNAVRTREALGILSRQGAFAVTAYEEWPFERMVEVASVASNQGWDVTSIRRGVLSRVEPTDRRLWTMRMIKDFVERMLVVAAPTDQPYAGDAARLLAERLVSLCPRIVLFAPGDGNALLRDEVIRLGASALDAGGPVEILEALDAVGEATQPETETAPTSPKARQPGADRGPAPAAELRELLSGEQLPEPAELERVIARFGRVHRAFAAVEDLLREQESAGAQERLAAMLRAAHAVAPEKARIPEGVTLLVRGAGITGMTGPLGPILSTEELVHRYGGPGLLDVITLSGTLQSSGWALRRALRGPTGRERREDPVLGAVEDAADGLWRLMIERGDVRGEVWFIADIPPEGRAAVPRLLQRERQRVVIVPVQSDVSQWYGGLGGPEPIGWTGIEVDEVLAEVNAWQPPQGEQTPSEHAAG